MPVVAVVLIIGGCSIWAAMQPKDVTYDDVLTTDNANTFADHNANWKGDDSDNVAYVQRAVQHLGANAYGRKFKDLIAWEKALEKGLGYGDKLTRDNVNLFSNHNASWNSDDPDNVAYVKRALQHLGDKAYGQTFGDLMDWEKD